MLLKDNPKYRIFIYGDGNERGHLEDYVRENNISNVVFKEKRIPLCEVAWVVSQATVNVMNYQKNFGLHGVSSGKMFQYFAAGKPISWYEERLPDFPFVRAMPNVNAGVNAGITAICGGSCATAEHVILIRGIFDAVGKTYVLDEKHFSAFSAIAGAAPAYTYLYMDALASAGVKAGLTKQTSLAIAADMVLGSAVLLQKTGEHPAVLVDKVCSPGGTTIEGLHRLRELGFEHSVYEAIAAVIEKDKSLGS